MGVFTSKKIGAGEVIGCYYGTLVYENLSEGPSNRRRVYGEGTMAVPVENFAKWALKLQHQTQSGKDVRIYPAPFCVMRLLNDARYTTDEPGRPTDGQLKANPDNYRQNHVQFVDGSKANSTIADFRRHNIVQVKALRNIPEAAELYVSYGPNYDSFHE